jgi:general secretion pathway protein G
VHQRLQQRIRAARKADGGFTLIELLIVIVILGVLAGVVVFSVQAISNRGNNAACETNKKSLASAAAAFYADNNNQYPTLGQTAGITDWSSLAPKYLQQIPTDGRDYKLDTSNGVVSNDCTK